MCEAFEQLCDLLESSCENDLFSIDQLHQRITDIMQSEQVYSKKHLQWKREERYGKYIFFGKGNNVIGFTDICSFLINDKWHNERKNDIANDSERIVKAAAKLLCHKFVKWRLTKLTTLPLITLRSIIITFLHY